MRVGVPDAHVRFVWTAFDSHQDASELPLSRDHVEALRRLRRAAPGSAARRRARARVRASCARGSRRRARAGRGAARARSRNRARPSRSTRSAVAPAAGKIAGADQPGRVRVGRLARVHRNAERVGIGERLPVERAGRGIAARSGDIGRREPRIELRRRRAVVVGERRERAQRRVAPRRDRRSRAARARARGTSGRARARRRRPSRAAAPSPLRRPRARASPCVSARRAAIMCARVIEAAIVGLFGRGQRRVERGLTLREAGRPRRALRCASARRSACARDRPLWRSAREGAARSRARHRVASSARSSSAAPIHALSSAALTPNVAKRSAARRNAGSASAKR